jgi:hypothetical protein
VLPSDPEVARIEGELDAVWHVLAERAKGHGLSLPAEPAVEPSRFDADAAYETLRDRVAHARRTVQTTFAAVRDANPALATLHDLGHVHAVDEAPPGVWRRRLAPFGAAFVVVPFVLALFYAAQVSERDERLAVAASLCAKPPPCERDTVEIGYASPHDDGDGIAPPGFVLYRLTADCSRNAAVYFGPRGSYQFRGSPDDPDPAKREDFLRQREVWFEGRELLSRVSCGEVENLDVGAFTVVESGGGLP